MIVEFVGREILTEDIVDITVDNRDIVTVSMKDETVHTNTCISQERAIVEYRRLWECKNRGDAVIDSKKTLKQCAGYENGPSLAPMIQQILRNQILLLQK